jgi:hypothetical protein
MRALSSSVHRLAVECSGGQRIPASLWFFSLETHTLGTCQFQKRRPRYHVHARALDAVERLLRWRKCLEPVFLTHFAQCSTFIYLIYHTVPELFSTLLPMHHYILMCVSFQQMLILASLLLPIRQIVCIHKRRRIRGPNFRGFVREREVLDICVI